MSPQILNRLAEMSTSLGDRSLQWIHKPPSTARLTRKGSKSTCNKETVQRKGCLLHVAARTLISESLKLLRCSRPPRLGHATGNGAQRETEALVGAITPETKLLQIRNNRIISLLPYQGYTITDRQIFECKCTITLIQGYNNQAIDITSQQQPV